MVLVMFKTGGLQYCTCVYIHVACKFQIFEGLQVCGPVITNNDMDLAPVLHSMQVINRKPCGRIK